MGRGENVEWSRRPDTLAELAPSSDAPRLFFFPSPIRPTGEPVFTCWLAPARGLSDIVVQLASRVSTGVGIVGMPGCGKSALLGFLRDMGLPCFSADESVAELYGPDGDGAAMIRQRFGGQYSLEDGAVDKPGLFAAMQVSETVRRDVMDMIHPMVRHQCEEFFKVHRDESAAFAEIPLLLESGWHKIDQVDLVVGVRCPADKRTGELREKLRGILPETLAVFDSWQWSESDKLAACDLVLDNAKGLEELRSEAVRLKEYAYEVGAQRKRDYSKWLDGVWPALAAELDAAESDS